jgi:hypothetical protein
LGEESIGLNILKKFHLSRGFFLCGVLVNLKNKGVLLSGIGRGKDLFLGWGWVVGEKGGYSFCLPFFPFS